MVDPHLPGVFRISIVCVHKTKAALKELSSCLVFCTLIDLGVILNIVLECITVQLVMKGKCRSAGLSNGCTDECGDEKKAGDLTML